MFTDIRDTTLYMTNEVKKH